VAVKDSINLPRDSERRVRESRVTVTSDWEVGVRLGESRLIRCCSRVVIICNDRHNRETNLIGTEIRKGRIDLGQLSCGFGQLVFFVHVSMIARAAPLVIAEVKEP
jgi:hypothetical protein